MKCSCGKRMTCIDSRPTGENLTRRRYRCSCGHRQSSIEMPVDETGPGIAMAGSVMGHDVLRRIIAICTDEIANPAIDRRSTPFPHRGDSRPPEAQTEKTK